MGIIRVCSPLGAFIFRAYRYGEWRKIITDLSVVVFFYGDTYRFKVLFRTGAWPLRSRSRASQKGDSTDRGYKFPHSALCLVHKILWNFSSLLHVPAKVYVHDCLYLGLTSMWTIFQLFWRYCFQICGSSTQHWDECHPKPCGRWNIYSSSTHVKFKYRDCPSCTTFLMQNSSYLPINHSKKVRSVCSSAPMHHAANCISSNPNTRGHVYVCEHVIPNSYNIFLQFRTTNYSKSSCC